MMMAFPPIFLALVLWLFCVGFFSCLVSAWGFLEFLVPVDLGLGVGWDVGSSWPPLLL